MPNKAEAKTESSVKVTANNEKANKTDAKAKNLETKKTADLKVSKTNLKTKANSVKKPKSETADETKENELNSKAAQTALKEKIAEIEKNIITKTKENPNLIGKSLKNLVTVNKLMETGAHFGLPARKWNPKMKQYIHAKKGSNHIIDLMHTVIAINVCYNFLYDLTKNYVDNESAPILLVGTKGKTIKNHIKEQAKRCHAFYVNERWLGGTLTNFSTIQKSIIKFNNLILIHKNGEINKYTKKEQVNLKKKTEKYAKFFSGIRTMKDLPKAIFLTDSETNKIAIKEAKKLEIPVIAICNTNADPELVDYVIPANNFSIKTVFLIIGIMCDAIAEAKGLPKMYVGKKDEEIVLPEVIKKKPERPTRVFVTSKANLNQNQNQ